MDELTGEHNSKQKGGAVGFFTKNRMSRTEFYTYGLLVALSPFLNESLYSKRK